MAVNNNDLARLNALLNTATAALSDARAFAAGLTVEPVPPPPPTPGPTTTTIKSAVHRYYLSGPIVGADYYDLQDGKWLDLTKFPTTAKKFRYVTTCSSGSDLVGDRQFVPTARSVPYIAKNTAGRVISRTQNKDSLLDISSLELRTMIVGNIKNLVSRFDGLYMDEVDDTWGYGYPNSGMIALSNGVGVDAWRAAMVKFVSDVANELHQLGKQLWINLGLTGDESVSWRDQILKLVDAVNIEYFIGRDLLGRDSEVDTDWLTSVNRLATIESAGIPVHAHCSSTVQTTIDYAFASWLMGTQFRGSFCASLDYSGDVYGPSVSLMTHARQLGRPLTAMGTVSTGYVRRFEGGDVYVNPFSTTRGGTPSRDIHLQMG